MWQLQYRVSAAALFGALMLWPTAATSQIKIGVSAPLTGPVAAFGTQITQGTQAAIDLINNQNGIKGTKMEAVLGDDGCRADQAATVAERLIVKDSVVALIGFPCSAAALAAETVAARMNVLMILLASSSTLTVDRYNVLRVIGGDDRQARIVVEYLAANFNGKRVGAWLSDRSPSFNLAFGAALETKNLKMQRLETSPSADVSPPPWKDDVDAIVVSPSAAAVIAIRPAEWQVRPTIIVPAPLLTAELANLVRTDRNIVAITNPAPDYFEGGIALARTKFERWETSGYFIYAYSAVQVFATVAREAGGNFSANALVAAAQKTTISTAVGSLTFNERGDIRNWQFAAYSAQSGPNVCKSPTCKQYDQCPPDCPK